jgi:hypothetical protein
VDAAVNVNLTVCTTYVAYCDPMFVTPVVKNLDKSYVSAAAESNVSCERYVVSFLHTMSSKPLYVGNCDFKRMDAAWMILSFSSPRELMMSSLSVAISCKLSVLVHIDTPSSIARAEVEESSVDMRLSLSLCVGL